MITINIYMVINSVDNQIVYVGASEATPRYIGIRHKGRFGKLHFIEVIETAESVKEAANLEEYWFWQIKTWGFSLVNKLPFKRYRGRKDRVELSQRRPIDFKKYIYSDFRLSQKSIELIKSIPELFLKVKDTLKVKSDQALNNNLSKNKWNGRLTIFQVSADIQKISGLPKEDVYEQVDNILANRPQENKRISISQ